MRINQKVIIGINAVTLLRKASKPLRVVDIAESIKATPAFLEQIMRSLRVSGIVTVKRGPGGGYTAVEEKTTVAQIARAVGVDVSIKPVDVSQAEYNLRYRICDAYNATEV